MPKTTAEWFRSPLHDWDDTLEESYSEAGVRPCGGCAIPVPAAHAWQPQPGGDWYCSGCVGDADGQS
jgi:hypothetical protein